MRLCAALIISSAAGLTTSRRSAIASVGLGVASVVVPSVACAKIPYKTKAAPAALEADDGFVTAEMQAYAKRLRFRRVLHRPISLDIANLGTDFARLRFDDDATMEMGGTTPAGTAMSFRLR